MRFWGFQASSTRQQITQYSITISIHLLKGTQYARYKLQCCQRSEASEIKQEDERKTRHTVSAGILLIGLQRFSGSHACLITSAAKKRTNGWCKLTMSVDTLNLLQDKSKSQLACWKDCRSGPNTHEWDTMATMWQTRSNSCESEAAQRTIRVMIL